MIRGVIAEAAFEQSCLREHTEWTIEEIPKESAYDYLILDKIGSVRVQVKLQRSEKSVPKVANGLFVVETQRTRSGNDRTTGGSTRPYRFGEFDILAVCMQPSTGSWHRFLYTVERWLIPRPDENHLLKVLQPIPPSPNDDWTDNIQTCIDWFRSGEQKSIATKI
jgi:hypothetical protein